MSRTKHRTEDRSKRRTPRATLTKGTKAAQYTPSNFDQPANRGKPGSWAHWLHDYNGYLKQQKRRKRRKVMKAYARRVDRRAGKRSLALAL